MGHDTKLWRGLFIIRNFRWSSVKVTILATVGEVRGIEVAVSGWILETHVMMSKAVADGGGYPFIGIKAFWTRSDLEGFGHQCVAIAKLRAFMGMRRFLRPEIQ